MEPKKFSIAARIKSFKYAINGLRLLIQEEHNFRVHFVAAFLALMLGWILKLSRTEWMILLLTIALVLTSEIINTTIEILCNMVSPEFHYSIKKIKDISAAAVLVCAVVAIIIGYILFFEKMVGYL